LVVAGAACAGRGAWAGTVVATAGFEAPHYTVGNLRTQQGWQVGFLTAGSTATVNASTPGGTGQGVRVDRAPGSDYRWAVPTTGFPTGRYVSVRWAMRVEQSTGFAGTLGPFFGVEGYDSVGAGGVLGSLGVDATTGEVLYQLAGSGALVAAAVPPLTFGSWNNFELLFDFQADSYRALVNGTQVATQSFIDDFAGNELNDFSDADIATFAIGESSAEMARTGTAYFDNFVVFDGRVGDYNNDGAVDAADYTVWRDTQGSIGATLAADGNGDRIVDNADYVSWSAAYGTTPTSTALAVPEPGRLGVIAVAIASMFRRSGPRR
jgi:hypothetical protein